MCSEFRKTLLLFISRRSWWGGPFGAIGFNTHLIINAWIFFFSFVAHAFDVIFFVAYVFDVIYFVAYIFTVIARGYAGFGQNIFVHWTCRFLVYDVNIFGDVATKRNKFYFFFFSYFYFKNTKWLTKNTCVEFQIFFQEKKRSFAWKTIYSCL